MSDKSKNFNESGKKQQQAGKQNHQNSSPNSSPGKRFITNREITIFTIKILISIKRKKVIVKKVNIN